jgi:predicted DNA repair protein MutK
VVEITDPAELEDRQVGGAVRTDFILSAEIMAIALASLPAMGLTSRAAVLALVAVAITFGVYGFVALIVKMDDVGLHMSERGNPLSRRIGHGLVDTMPVLLNALSLIGTGAMLWVGGGIFSHGLAEFGLGVVPHTVEHFAHAVAEPLAWGEGAVEWLVEALGSAVVGLVVGGFVVMAMHVLPRKRAAH